jgi:hypothetical protein
MQFPDNAAAGSKFHRPAALHEKVGLAPGPDLNASLNQSVMTWSGMLPESAL